MDMVLKICVNDGEEIIIDGFDTIEFYNQLPNAEVENSGYTWQRDLYHSLLNNLEEYKFIGVIRNDSKDDLSYRNHSFAFNNGTFDKNETLYLRTSCITTIIDLYN